MEPVNLLHMDQDGLFILNSEHFPKPKSNDTENIQLVVIGILGPRNSGKSFLLNYIMRYFHNGGYGSWMRGNSDNNDAPLEGFVWDSRKPKKSRMIEIWPEILYPPKEGENSPQLGIIIMEFHVEPGDEMYKYFLGFAVSSCSLIILNEMTQIHYATLSSLAITLNQFSSSNGFISYPNIAILVRDFLSPTKGYGKQIGKEYLNTKIEGTESDLKNPNIFNKIMIHVFPTPGFLQNTSFNGSVSSLGSYKGYLKVGITKVLELPQIQFQDTKRGELNYFLNSIKNLKFNLNCELIKQLNSGLSLHTEIKIGEPMEVDENESRLEDTAQETSDIIVQLNNSDNDNSPDSTLGNGSFESSKEQEQCTTSKPGVVTHHQTTYTVEMGEKYKSPRQISSMSLTSSTPVRTPLSKSKVSEEEINFTSEQASTNGYEEETINENSLTPMEKSFYGQQESESMDVEIKADEKKYDLNTIRELINSVDWFPQYEKKMDEIFYNFEAVAEINKEEKSIKNDCLNYLISLCGLESSDIKSFIETEIMEDVCKSVRVKLNSKHNILRLEMNERCRQFMEAYENAISSALSQYLAEANANWPLTTGAISNNKFIIEAKSKVTGISRDLEGEYKKNFDELINQRMIETNQLAKRFFDAINNFLNSIERKFELETCFDEQKLNILLETEINKILKDNNTSKFRPQLDQGLSTYSIQFRNRNKIILAQEEEVADYTCGKLEEFYTNEMKKFLHEKVHTSEDLKGFQNYIKSTVLNQFKQIGGFKYENFINTRKDKLGNFIDSRFDYYKGQNLLQAEKTRALMGEAFRDGQKRYKDLMDKRISQRSMKPNELNQLHTDIRNDVSFEYRSKIYQIAKNCDEKDQDSLKASIDTIYEDYKKENNYKIKEEEEQRKLEEIARKADQERERLEKKRKQDAAAAAAAEKEAKMKSQWTAPKAQSSPNSYSDPLGVGTSKIKLSKPTTPVNIIGIELGLSFVRAGIYDSATNTFQKVKFENNEDFMPCIVGFDSDGTTQVGNSARKCSCFLSVGDVIRNHVKNNLSYVDHIFINGENTFFRIEKLLGLILAKVKLVSEVFFGSSITRAVISFPLWYTVIMKRITVNAAKLGGFDGAKFVSEGIASGMAVRRNLIFSSTYQISSEFQDILVAIENEEFFDVAHLKINNLKVQMIKSEGNCRIMTNDKTTVERFCDGAKSMLGLGSKSTEIHQIVKAVTKSQAYSKAILVSSFYFSPKITLEEFRDEAKVEKSKTHNSSQLIYEGVMLFAENWSNVVNAVKVMEVTSYPLILKDWTGKSYKICDKNSPLEETSLKINVDLKPKIFQRTRINFNLFELNAMTEEIQLGHFHIPTPSNCFEKFNFDVLVNRIGCVLEAEYKFGCDRSTEVQNVKFSPLIWLDDLELGKAKVEIAEYIEQLVKVTKPLTSPTRDTPKYSPTPAPVVPKFHDGEVPKYAQKDQDPKLEEAFANYGQIEKAILDSISEKKLIQLLHDAMCGPVFKVREKIKDYPNITMEVLTQATDELQKLHAMYVKSK